MYQPNNNSTKIATSLEFRPHHRIQINFPFIICVIRPQIEKVMYKKDTQLSNTLVASASEENKSWLKEGFITTKTR